MFHKESPSINNKSQYYEYFEILWMKAIWSSHFSYDEWWKCARIENSKWKQYQHYKTSKLKLTMTMTMIPSSRTLSFLFFSFLSMEIARNPYTHTHTHIHVICCWCHYFAKFFSREQGICGMSSFFISVDIFANAYLVSRTPKNVRWAQKHFKYWSDRDFKILYTQYHVHRAYDAICYKRYRLSRRITITKPNHPVVMLFNE